MFRPVYTQPATAADAPAFYDLFAADGDYLGSVRLAFAAAGPLVIRSGTIYTWIEDDLEVPYVVRAPLSWGRSSRLNGGPHDRDTAYSTLPRG